MKHFLTLVIGTLMGFWGTAQADTPSYVTVRSIACAGSGCPAGTVAENVSPDLQAFTLLLTTTLPRLDPVYRFRPAARTVS